jgi:hypothetical protein
MKRDLLATLEKTSGQKHDLEKQLNNNVTYLR